MATKKPLITGLTRAREVQYQAKISARLSASIEAALAPEIKKTITEFGKNNASERDKILTKHKSAVADILKRGYKKAFEQFGKRILDAGKKHHANFEKKDLYKNYEKHAGTWIDENTAKKVKQIANTTRDQSEALIQKITTESIGLGLSQAEAGKLIADGLSEWGADISRHRSRVIARTETHAASQAASQTAAEEIGFKVLKEWVSGNTDRTRDDHAEADGQTVELDQPFSVGGEQLMHPGDASGSAENVINCRCVAVHVAAE
jgi:uncharacterized protein with gpF-like domain